MFSFLSGVVLRRPWVIVSAWLALTAGLYYFGPRWEQVTKDDDVRFFPPGSLSVIGQDLLERGFPRDASSSQLVLVYERKDQRRDAGRPPSPRRSRRQISSSLPCRIRSSASTSARLARHAPDRSAADRQGRQGIEQAALVIVQFQGTYLSKKTRIAVDRVLEWLKKEGPPAPAGLELVVTGSAVVGRDSNRAANESIQNTTYSTIGLVVLILLIVYRSPLLAMIPLVTIALSVFVSLRLIALLTFIPGLGFTVINITQVFVVVVLFGAGTDYCLFLIARYCEELRHRRVDRPTRCAKRSPRLARRLVASAGTVIIGLGMLYFSTFAKVKYTGPTIAISLAVALCAALTLAPAMLVLLGRSIFWPFRSPHLSAAAESGMDEPEASIRAGILGARRRPGRRPSAADPLGLPGRAPSPGGRRCPKQVQPQPVERARPGYSERDRDRHRQTVFRRRRAEPGDRTYPPSQPRLPIAAGPSGD